MIPSKIARPSLLSSLLLLGQRVTGTAVPKASIPSCDSVVETTTYDYIIIGAGAGGGPIAARLALANYNVLLVDAGSDPYLSDSYYNYSTPLYFALAEQDPTHTIAYNISLYTSESAYSNLNVTEYYPRSQSLGGSAVHNALLNVDQSEWDFNNYASILGDDSWNYDTIKGTYMKRIENAIWSNDTEMLEENGHGIGGWLTVDFAPLALATAEPDVQLGVLVQGIENASNWFPNYDMNSISANDVEGTAIIQLTKQANHLRSSVRDFLNETMETNSNLIFSPYTYVTKIDTCEADSTDDTGAGVRAYGIQYYSGEYLMPASSLYSGPAKTSLKSAQAKYEVILAGGFAQTPQLLMLSGIGDPAVLNEYDIPTVVESVGVGKNFQDRIEISINWKLKNNTMLYEGCTFGSTDADPCLEAWNTDGHTNLYGSGAGFFMNLTRSREEYPYIDIATIWVPGWFRGYYPGFQNDFISQSPNTLSALILKGHSQATGFVNITGNSPFDKVVGNKNLYATPASLQDLVDVREAVKTARAVVENNPIMMEYILEEQFPGPAYQTDEELDEIIAQIAWGHHACCTAKFGAEDDETAVLDNTLSVKGMKRLRVVDNSIWPVIPALFVTTPIYSVSEKLSDIVIEYAETLNWTPSGATKRHGY